MRPEQNLRFVEILSRFAMLMLFAGLSGGVACLSIFLKMTNILTEKRPTAKTKEVIASVYR